MIKTIEGLTKVLSQERIFSGLVPVNVVLNREHSETETFGVLRVNGLPGIHTIELPWKDNRRSVSCIPEGVYHCSWIEESASGKYKETWIVNDVPGRSGILFHSGNTTADTRGCIIPGLRADTNKSCVLDSRRAMTRLRETICKNNFILHINNWGR